MVYNKEPIEVMYDFVKSLKDALPIYKEAMYEDKNSAPASYCILRSQITDTPENFGDGKVLIRKASCDIILISKGHADSSKSLHNVNKRKIINQLKTNDVAYKVYNNGYDINSKQTEHTFSFDVEYVV